MFGLRRYQKIQDEEDLIAELDCLRADLIAYEDYVLVKFKEVEEERRQALSSLRVVTYLRLKAGDPVGREEIQQRIQAISDSQTSKLNALIRDHNEFMYEKNVREKLILAKVDQFATARKDPVFFLYYLVHRFKKKVRNILKRLNGRK